MTDVIIVGGGLAGLSAALHLQKKGKSFLLLEAEERVGGRIKTDVVDGFQLDHGFQVLLTAYEEAKAILNYQKLNLKKFDPGAIILQNNGSIAKLGDPWRKPSTLFSTLNAPVGSFSDKFKILTLRGQLMGRSIETIFQEKETSTREYLANYGFSTTMIDNFFRPFYGGIFLEKELSSSSRMFEFVFKLLGNGDVAIPAKGMEQIPLQLAQQLDPNSILCNEKVVSIDSSSVKTASGKSFEASNIILATQATQLPFSNKSNFKQKFQSVTNIYYSSSKSPLNDPMIALNHDTSQMVNTISIMNKVAPDYAPKGKNLISVSVNGNHNDSSTLQQVIKNELSNWFGSDVASWEHLKTYSIRYALPNQSSVRNIVSSHELKIGDHLYICGDHLFNGSINAALKSGRLVAEMID